MIYLVNGWIQRELVPILVFTGIFIAGYFLIWSLISQSIKHSVRKLNAKLSQ